MAEGVWCGTGLFRLAIPRCDRTVRYLGGALEIVKTAERAPSKSMPACSAITASISSDGFAAHSAFAAAVTAKNLATTSPLSAM